LTVGGDRRRGGEVVWDGRAVAKRSSPSGSKTATTHASVGAHRGYADEVTTVQPRTANQPPPLEGYDLYGENRPLVEAVSREGAEWADESLRGFGILLGGEPLELGRLANENSPRLRTHDRFGERIDEVEFHSAWHALLGLGVERGLHASPWREPRSGAHVARAAAFITLAEVEAGVGCPLSMTFAAVPALRAEPTLVDEWAPLLTSTRYDPGLRPAADKPGALCGMAMTERQGGSDVRANETVARPLGDGEATLHGHKWFCSAPMCDAFLVLAQAPGGLTCYLLSRVLPDGGRNAFHIDRLKDKLGNRSNASAEIRLDGAWARRVGEEGRGVATIIEMVVHTRLDCVLGSTGLMRRAVAEAAHHAVHRSAFGRRLVEQPLMENVLADLCIDSEAATLLALRLARAYDEDDAPFRRLATGVAKYWVCKTTPPFVAEALECLGGNGYVEESVLPRLYRESPLNSVWEGPANVQALDVLRALVRQPESLDAVLRELELAAGMDARLDSAVSSLRAEFGDPEEAGARRLVERLALCLAGSLLLRHGAPVVAEAFCASRLGGEAGRTYGTLPRGVDTASIVERHRPRV
jgi:putative acyl-CoA dehydrogenase